MIKLLEHFRKMQEAAAAYISPGSYTDIEGNTHIYDKVGGSSRAFVNDMLYMLDGPEQREAEAMESFDYVAEAHVTLSPQWHGDMVAKFRLMGALERSINALRELDLIKKTLFYGKDNGLAGYHGFASGSGTAPVTCGSLPETMALGRESNAEEMANLLHGVIGMATEAGELLELLDGMIKRTRTFDKANLIEEVGDSKWYMAILSRVGGFVWGDDERTNIAKLRARFPDRFTEYDANNRNLAAERVILEGDAANQLHLPINERTNRMEGELNRERGQPYRTVGDNI